MTSPNMRHDLLYGNIRLFAGTSTPELAQEISDYLNIPLCGRDVIEFTNENLFVKLHSSVRGQDCYIIQTTSIPVHRNLMELLIMTQTLRLDSAGRITVVVPYMCYGRSDRKDQPRVPITARLVADMIQVAGADRYITMDLHAGQIQGFFSIPGDVLSGYHIIKPYLMDLLPSLNRPVMLTADLGFAKRGRRYAQALNIPLAFIEKRRVDNEEHSEALSIIGQVSGRDVILIDDEIDTGGSICEAVNLAKQYGAGEILVVFVHPVLSANAVERLASLPVKQFITTNTIPIAPDKKALFGDRLTILSIGPLIGEVIKRANEGTSVGAMFNE
ncbi:MAG TPA: ribose-phosphate diphosphokinase [Anaerolineaceae bacterium]|nr:ribose-phosphate diphosphokinase [Anaerolineaceae bacterium]HOT26042.1 ribose-phosphate diphosphokinase [Anaerolineaceae bacterium]HQH58278.1 ribose-phosphate diphosphokinase [Anaerolineaceae bacterium]HQK02709.1 ribose-phosphate diphosphokinase [Anaerolineaceae bacterium]HQL27743.1 ribose-phosphate diphosphokinase [Anaerolineaceae bacterium]